MSRAFLLKAELRLLYQLDDPRLAPAHLDGWLAWASRSRLALFIKLARTIRRHRAGILNATRPRPSAQAARTDHRLDGRGDQARDMGLGPIPAIQRLLAATDMSMDDVDVVEINEAFAAQIIPCKEELGVGDDKLNPFRRGDRCATRSG